MRFWPHFCAPFLSWFRKKEMSWLCILIHWFYFSCHTVSFAAAAGFPFDFRHLCISFGGDSPHGLVYFTFMMLLQVFYTPGLWCPICSLCIIHLRLSYIRQKRKSTDIKSWQVKMIVSITTIKHRAENAWFRAFSYDGCVSLALLFYCLTSFRCQTISRRGPIWKRKCVKY